MRSLFVVLSVIVACCLGGAEGAVSKVPTRTTSTLIVTSADCSGLVGWYADVALDDTFQNEVKYTSTGQGSGTGAQSSESGEGTKYNSQDVTITGATTAAWAIRQKLYGSATASATNGGYIRTTYEVGVSSYTVTLNGVELSGGPGPTGLSVTVAAGGQGPAEASANTPEPIEWTTVVTGSRSLQTSDSLYIQVYNRCKISWAASAPNASPASTFSATGSWYVVPRISGSAS